MKWEVYSRKLIESFVLSLKSRKKFSPKFKELREHLKYCDRCRAIFKIVVEEYKLELSVDEAIYPGLLLNK